MVDIPQMLRRLRRTEVGWELRGTQYFITTQEHGRFVSTFLQRQPLLPQERLGDVPLML